MAVGGAWLIQSVTDHYCVRPNQVNHSPGARLTFRPREHVRIAADKEAPVQVCSHAMTLESACVNNIRLLVSIRSRPLRRQGIDVRWNWQTQWGQATLLHFPPACLG